uniref:Transcription regulator Pbf-2 n=1 Tax=Chlamydomonas reinhardtii TaxID=3055 RepID=A2PZC9_CHLRE|nr:transcription regulator Pbf-2 [Chlamydomonas reinhardtii]
MLLSRLAHSALPASLRASAASSASSQLHAVPRVASAAPRAPSHVAQYSNGSAAPVPPNFAAPNDRAATSSSDRVYTNYYVYKTRAAMCLRLLPPTFAKAQAGKVLERDGTMLLEFATANAAAPGAGNGPAGNVNRTYNWGNKVTFALSPVELGNILAGDAVASDKGLVLWHDPAKLGKTGEPIKKLSLKQLPDGNISFNLTAGPENFSVPVTKGEFEVIKSVAQFAIPRLLGFDAVFE